MFSVLPNVLFRVFFSVYEAVKMSSVVYELHHYFYSQKNTIWWRNKEAYLTF